MFDSPRAVPLGRPGSFAGSVVAGMAIAGSVTLLMYEAPPVWTFLVAAMLVTLLPAFVVQDARLYWTAVFLLFSPIEIKKSLVDGLKIKAALGIDYIQPVLVPELRLGDLAFAVLLLLWLVRWSLRRDRLYIPPVGFLALAYLAWATLSILKAPIPYLSWIELAREVKYFLIFLWAVNCVDAKRWLRLIAIVLTWALLLQAGMTLARASLKFEFLGGDTFGRAGIEVAKSEHLSITSKGQRDTSILSLTSRRSFGTVPSPAGTAKYIVLVLPFVLGLALTTSSRRVRYVLAVLALLAFLALYLTFSRAGLLGLGAVTILSLWFIYRKPQLRRVAVRSGALLAVVALMASPVLYSYWFARRENVTIRFAQYERSFRMISANAILGVGLNNSPGLQRKYSPGETSSVPLGDPTNLAYTNPIHEYYLTLLAEVGIVGFLLYLGFFGRVVWHGMRLARQGDSDTAIFSTMCAIGIVGLAAIVTADPLSEDAVLTLAWLYAGLIVAAVRMTAKTEDAAPALVRGAAR